MDGDKKQVQKLECVICQIQEENELLKQELLAVKNNNSELLMDAIYLKIQLDELKTNPAIKR
jgi:hypothetical protein